MKKTERRTPNIEIRTRIYTETADQKTGEAVASGQLFTLIHFVTYVFRFANKCFFDPLFLK